MNKHLMALNAALNQQTDDQRIEQLERQLKTAQDALRNVHTILFSVKSDDENAWFEIGRAMGTASNGFIMSGGRRG